MYGDTWIILDPVSFVLSVTLIFKINLINKVY